MTTTVPADLHRNRKQRELNNRRGIPNRVDADRARTHLQHLRTTMGWASIAAATGCSACHLRYIASGKTRIINRITHERILGTHPAPTATGGLYIDATGTRRRIHALAAIGHSQNTIAGAAHTTQHRISVISLGAPRVRQKIADRIADAYQQLAHAPAPDNPFSRRCRNHAAAQGWKDPAYWDDVDRIDDPTFDPDAKTPRIVQVAQDAWWLLRAGEHRNTIAARLGVSRDYIDKALRQIPEEQVAA